MPLSPLVSADVLTASIAVQHLLSGPAQPFSFLNFHQGELVQEQRLSKAQPAGSYALRDITHCTSEPNDRINSRRF